MDFCGAYYANIGTMELIFPLQIQIRGVHNRNLFKIWKEEVNEKLFLCTEFGIRCSTLEDHT